MKKLPYFILAVILATIFLVAFSTASIAFKVIAIAFSVLLPVTIFKFVEWKCKPDGSARKKKGVIISSIFTIALVISMIALGVTTANASDNGKAPTPSAATEQNQQNDTSGTKTISDAEYQEYQALKKDSESERQKIAMEFMTNAEKGGWTQEHIKYYGEQIANGNVCFACYGILNNPPVEGCIHICPADSNDNNCDNNTDGGGNIDNGGNNGGGTTPTPCPEPTPQPSPEPTPTPTPTPEPSDEESPIVKLLNNLKLEVGETKEIKGTATDNVGVTKLDPDGKIEVEKVGLLGSTNNFDYTVSVKDNNNFVISVTGKKVGQNNVYVAAEAAEDAAGNKSEASNKVCVEVVEKADSESPVVELLNGLELKVGETKIINGIARDNIAVTKLNLENKVIVEKVGLLGSTGNFDYTVEVKDNNNFTITVTGKKVGQNNVYVAAEAAEDAAGNKSEASNKVCVKVTDNPKPDTESPVVQLLNGLEMFEGETKVISGVITDDVEVTEVNLTAKDIFLTESGIVTGDVSVQDNNHFTITLTAKKVGSTEVSVLPGVAKDAAGNTSKESNKQPVIVKDKPDTESPVVTLLNGLELNVGETKSISGTASDDVAVTELNLGSDAVTFSNGACISYTVNKIDNNNFTIDVTGTAEGTTSVQVIEGVAKDATGNTSAASNVVNVKVTDNTPEPTPDSPDVTLNLFGENESEDGVATFEVGSNITMEAVAWDRKGISSFVVDGKIVGLDNLTITSISQTAPERYLIDVSADKAGSYGASIVAGAATNVDGLVSGDSNPVYFKVKSQDESPDEPVFPPVENDTEPPVVQLVGGDTIFRNGTIHLTAIATDDNKVSDFYVDANSLKGLTPGLEIKKITKTSDTTYDIELFGREVGSYACNIIAGAAVDMDGHPSDKSNEALVFVVATGDPDPDVNSDQVIQNPSFEDPSIPVEGTPSDDDVTFEESTTTTPSDTEGTTEVEETPAEESTPPEEAPAEEEGTETSGESFENPDEIVQGNTSEDEIVFEEEPAPTALQDSAAAPVDSDS